MSKIMKWVGLGGAIFFSLLTVAIIAIYMNGTSQVHASFSVQPDQVTIPTDTSSIGQGRHLAESIAGCTGCHGAKLEGSVLLEDEAIGALYSPNLTKGRGGIGASYTDADFVRAIRHGVGKDGRGLLVMPSKAYDNLTNQDLGAIIAYVKSVPPVDNEVPPAYIKAFGRVLASVGAFGDLVAAKKIDHDAEHKDSIQSGATAEYGEYLVSIGDCRACHGEQLAGGNSGEPGAPPAPNLTQGGELRGWKEEDFLKTMQTGDTPSGKHLDPKFMPWESFAKMTDQELKAVFAYLKSLPS